MNLVANYPYAKTTGVSLLLHGALLVLLVLLGPFAPVGPPPSLVAIEIVPAKVVDTGSATTFDEPAPPLGQQTSAVEPTPQMTQPSQVTARTEALPAAAMPEEASATPVAQPVFAGTSMIQGEASAPVFAGTGTGSGSAVGSNGTPTGKQGGTGRGGAPAGGIYNPKPRYPQAARRAGMEGPVLVRFLIDTDGSVTSVSVRESSGYDLLDEATVQQVKNWRYSPERNDAGEPVATYKEARVRFRLEDPE